MPTSTKRNQLQNQPSVSSLIRRVAPIRDSDLCLKVLKIFQNNSDIMAVPVVNNENVPLGIVDRRSFVEEFTKLYTREISGKKRITEFMLSNTIVVDVGTSLDDVSRMIIDAGMQHMISGFIITESGLYSGVANGHDLLNAITQRKQEQLFYLAHFDQLTNLPNRMLFMDRLSMALIDAKRKSTKVALLFIDLDNFKNFNDSMGHSFGDQLLIAIANRLYSCARENDTVARLSGDEFTIIIEDITESNQLEILCKRILDEMKLPLEIMGRSVYASASIGVALYPDDDEDANGLLLKADAAMYESKRNGRNTYRYYETGMRVYSLERMTLETDLRGAVERSEFELYYQPQISLKTRKVVTKEALIRWNHPNRGVLTPIHFIDLAEDTGLILPIGKWVIQEACRHYRLSLENGQEPLRISVNISAIQFYQKDFCEMVKEILEISCMHPSYLELELTESIFMLDIETVENTLLNLNALGIKLAIDDFGTGYSNLGYLRRFPISKLKVDQSFIRGIENETINMEIVKTIGALAKSMSLELVAEGVENDIEMQITEQCGCDFVQGYKFTQPLKAEDFRSWLYQYNKNLNAISFS